MKTWLYPVIFFVLLLAVWHWVTLTWPSVLLPDPFQVGRNLWDNTKNGTLLAATVVTIKRLLYGYAIGLALGLPLGMLAARWKIVRNTVGLMALGFQALPSVCWVPLALLWFGQTESAMLFVVVMGSLWSVLLATEAGVQHIPPIYTKAARTMGSKGLHLWFLVFLPASLPFLVTGMKQGWAFGWRSLMAAEIYVTIITGAGLGQLLHYGRELNAMDQVIGIMLVIIIIGLLTDKVIFSPWERFLHRRWGTSQAA